MKTTVSSVAAIAFLASASAPADPPTPLEKPERWEFIGAYHIGEGAGLESINAVIDPDSITRDGTIVRVYVGRDFTEVNGQWVPTYRNADGSLGAGSMIASYEIDCKYKTYNELWLETDLGFQNMPDEWIKIEPDSDVALAENEVCRGRAP
jgi:hypothetical protein